jgi:hypothetical protein
MLEHRLLTRAALPLNRAATVKERSRRILSLTLLASTVLLLAGCGGSMSRNSPLEVFPDMDRQGKFKPQTQSALFGDKRGSRMPVAGTVPSDI